MVGLYSHIPLDQGAEIMRRFLDKRKSQLASLESICKFLNITTLNCEMTFTNKS